MEFPLSAYVDSIHCLFSALFEDGVWLMDKSHWLSNYGFRRLI